MCTTNTYYLLQILSFSLILIFCSGVSSSAIYDPRDQEETQDKSTSHYTKEDENKKNPRSVLFSITKTTPIADSDSDFFLNPSSDEDPFGLNALFSMNKSEALITSISTSTTTTTEKTKTGFTNLEPSLFDKLDSEQKNLSIDEKNKTTKPLTTFIRRLTNLPNLILPNSNEPEIEQNTQNSSTENIESENDSKSDGTSNTLVEILLAQLPFLQSIFKNNKNNTNTTNPVEFNPPEHSTEDYNNFDNSGSGSSKIFILNSEEKEIPTLVEISPSSTFSFAHKFDKSEPSEHKIRLKNPPDQFDSLRGPSLDPVIKKLSTQFDSLKKKKQKEDDESDYELNSKLNSHLAFFNKNLHSENSGDQVQEESRVENMDQFHSNLDSSLDTLIKNLPIQFDSLKNKPNENRIESDHDSKLNSSYHNFMTNLYSEFNNKKENQEEDSDLPIESTSSESKEIDSKSHYLPDKLINIQLYNHRPNTNEKKTQDKPVKNSDEFNYNDNLDSFPSLDSKSMNLHSKSNSQKKNQVKKKKHSSTTTLKPTRRTTPIPLYQSQETLTLSSEEEAPPVHSKLKTTKKPKKIKKTSPKIHKKTTTEMPKKPSLETHKKMSKLLKNLYSKEEEDSKEEEEDSKEEEEDSKEEEEDSKESSSSESSSKSKSQRKSKKTESSSSSSSEDNEDLDLDDFDETKHKEKPEQDKKKKIIKHLFNHIDFPRLEPHDYYNSEDESKESSEIQRKNNKRNKNNKIKSNPKKNHRHRRNYQKS